MKIQLRGIILREAEYKEKDKIISILTDRMGIISAVVKGAKNIKRKNHPIAECFSYCEFSLYVGKNGYIVEDFELLELFWNIRNDLYNLSLSQYFVQLIFAFSPDESSCPELLRLFLNVLFYISEKKKSLSVLKSIFEIRGCSICGYMPNLTGCISCKSYDFDKIYFSVGNGTLICGNCFKNDAKYEKLNVSKISTPVLMALRHIVYSDFNKLFSFNISESFEKELEFISEKYIYYHLGSGFKALDFYKSISMN